MSKELIVIRLLQIIISVNTVIFIFSILQAKKGNISLHKTINITLLTITMIGVIGLVITVGLGWDYQSLTTPFRMRIHRCFSCPLSIVLPITTYFGWQRQRKKHLYSVYAASFFWLGTLITGIWFF